MLLANLEAPQRLTVPARWTQHEAFIFWSQVIAKQGASFLQRYSEQTSILEARLFHRINEMR